MSHLSGHRGGEVSSPPSSGPKRTAWAGQTCPVPPSPPHSLPNLPPHHLPWQHTGLGEVARVGIRVKTEKTNFLRRIRSPIEKRAFDNETRVKQVFRSPGSKLGQNSESGSKYNVFWSTSLLKNNFFSRTTGIYSDVGQWKWLSTRTFSPSKLFLPCHCWPWRGGQARGAWSESSRPQTLSRHRWTCSRSRHRSQNRPLWNQKHDIVLAFQNNNRYNFSWLTLYHEVLDNSVKCWA